MGADRGGLRLFDPVADSVRHFPLTDPILGPWRRDLVDGNPVTLPDGRLITPDQVLGEQRPGTRLVHVGDAGRTNELEEVCQQADTLVIEATYLEEEADMARQFAHLTARQAADLAKKAGVNNSSSVKVSTACMKTWCVLWKASSTEPNGWWRCSS